MTANDAIRAMITYAYRKGVRIDVTISGYCNDGDGYYCFITRESGPKEYLPGIGNCGSTVDEAAENTLAQFEAFDFSPYANL